MISKKLFIKNRFGEKLEAIKEYKEGKEKYPTVLLVPGLAMNYHEWGGSFDEISKKLGDNGFLTFRFSFAGCGNSEGDFKEMTISRQAKQVRDILNFILKDSLVNKKRIGILAQSMGGPSVIDALPLKIKTLVLLSSPFNPGESLKNVLKERNTYNPGGVSRLPRSDGSTTKIGPQIWDDFRKIDIKNKFKNSPPPSLLVLHGALDTKVSSKDARLLFKHAKKGKEIIIYPKGDHGLIEVSPKLRQKVLDKIVTWFNKTLKI